MQTLTTSRLRLEPQCEHHADALYPLLCDPRQWAYIDDGAPESLTWLRERFRRLETRASSDGQEHWLNWVLRRRAALHEPAEGAALGFVQATVLHDGRAWVAYQLGCEHWGQGLATEAVAAMLAHLADAYGATTVFAWVDERNAPSRRLLERLGFAVDGGRDTLTPDAPSTETRDLLYRRGPPLTEPV